MNTTTATAQYAPAQVGNGRTAHKVNAEQFSTETLCERTVSRVLTAEQAAKMKPCTKCAAAEAAAQVEDAAPAADVEEPAEVEAPAAPVEELEEAPAAPEPAADTVRVAVRTYRTRGGAKELRALLHVNCDCKVAATLAGTFDNLEDAMACARERVTGGPEIGQCMSSRPLNRPAAPAAEVEVPAEVEPEVEEPAVEEPEVEEPAAEVEQAPAAPAGQVEVTAYTAALEQLYCNGQDNQDRTLRVEAADVPETLASLRRMPRWNAGEERFTVNKVALILVRDVTGTRVWVRGEAAPIRVDFTGAPVAEDAPAETHPVDMAAVMAATRLLRRRREVQRVIDNRNNAMGMGTPAAPVEEPAPAPAAEEPAPAEQVQEEVTYGKPEWRTLKGIEAPFQLYGSQSGNWFRPAGDRKQCHGFPLEMVRTWTEASARYAEDAEGKRHSLGGLATRYWIATAV
jgi:hypothetical protein